MSETNWTLTTALFALLCPLTVAQTKPKMQCVDLYDSTGKVRVERLCQHAEDMKHMAGVQTKPKSNIPSFGTIATTGTAEMCREGYEYRNIYLPGVEDFQGVPFSKYLCVKKGEQITVEPYHGTFQLDHMQVPSDIRYCDQLPAKDANAECVRRKRDDHGCHVGKKWMKVSIGSVAPGDEFDWELHT